jgi:hypothetical protein
VVTVQGAAQLVRRCGLGGGRAYRSSGLVEAGNEAGIEPVVQTEVSV